jgi:hypothetical protein
MVRYIGEVKNGKARHKNEKIKVTVAKKGRLVEKKS